MQWLVSLQAWTCGDPIRCQSGECRPSGSTPSVGFHLFCCINIKTTLRLSPPVLWPFYLQILTKSHTDALFVVVSVYYSPSPFACLPVFTWGLWAGHCVCAAGSWQEMDRLLLSSIDEELESSEVAALCFLCSDVVNRKRLEGVRIFVCSWETHFREHVLQETDRQSSVFYTSVPSDLDESLYFLIVLQITDAKGLFLRLEEKGLLDSSFFLSHLLSTIHRVDLLNLLNAEVREQEETDAYPFLSEYR